MPGVVAAGAEVNRLTSFLESQTDAE